MKYLLLLFLIFTMGCVQHRELITLPEELTQLPAAGPISNQQELRIQPEDLLRITVHSLDEKAAAPFNLELPAQNQTMMQQVLGNNGTNLMELFNGFLVDQEGFIDFPGLGRQGIMGKTLEEVRVGLVEQLKQYIKDPVVNIRFLNLKVTVTGEVTRPGVVQLTNRRLTILEALGRAGDFTPYANRKNILVIREENGQRNYARLNLQKADIFSNPYFYLQQNDVIYVEPLRARVGTVSDPFTRLLPFISTGISLLTLIVALGK